MVLHRRLQDPGQVVVEGVAQGAVGDGKTRLPGQVVLPPGLPQAGMQFPVRLVPQPAQSVCQHRQQPKTITGVGAPPNKAQMSHPKIFTD